MRLGGGKERGVRRGKHHSHTHTPSTHTQAFEAFEPSSAHSTQHQTRKAAMMLSASLTRKAVAVRRANSSRSARVGAVRNGSRVCMMQVR